MSAKPEVGIGSVGYGLMGRAHAYGYAVAPRVRDLPCAPRLLVMSGRDAGAVAQAAGRYGVEEWTTDWREIVERPDVDIVDVCTPPGTHAEIVEAAAAAGKAVLCEKPLAVDYASAAAAAKAAADAGTPNAIGFNYRPVAALLLWHFLVWGTGTAGTRRFDYPSLNELWYGDAHDAATLYGLRRIRAEHPTHPYAADWWPIGQGIGYGTTFVNQAADHLERWPDGPWQPDLAQGARVQLVCDAMERAAAQRRWVTVEEPA